MQRNDPPTITYSTLHTGAGIVETLPLMGTEDDPDGVNIEHLIVYDEEVAANPTAMVETTLSASHRASMEVQEVTTTTTYVNSSCTVSISDKVSASGTFTLGMSINSFPKYHRGGKSTFKIKKVENVVNDVTILVVIIVKIIFIRSFLFYCLLLN